MPVYVYRCDHCGVQFERRQHFDDKPLTRCPECSQTSLRKLYQPAGIVFKGSGFYSTDHRSTRGMSSSNSSEKNGSDSKAESEEKATPADKSEKKAKKDD